MKKSILLLATMLTISANSFAQESKELRIVNGTILQGSIPITVSMAKDLSLSKSPSAYNYFQKANKIRTWNVVWWVAGGYEVVAGGYTLSQENEIGVLDMLLGGVLIGITPSREKKRSAYISLGVNEYNKSLSN